jgi:hypothetical protein
MEGLPKCLNFWDGQHNDGAKHGLGYESKKLAALEGRESRIAGFG